MVMMLAPKRKLPVPSRREESGRSGEGATSAPTAGTAVEGAGITVVPPASPPSSASHVA